MGEKVLNHGANGAKIVSVTSNGVASGVAASSG